MAFDWSKVFKASEDDRLWGCGFEERQLQFDFGENPTQDNGDSVTEVGNR